MFTLKLHMEIFEIENREEKTNCSSWQYLSFGTNMEVYLRVVKLGLEISLNFLWLLLTVELYTIYSILHIDRQKWMLEALFDKTCLPKCSGS